jgi:hypothetical protein
MRAITGRSLTPDSADNYPSGYKQLLWWVDITNSRLLKMFMAGIGRRTRRQTRTRGASNSGPAPPLTRARRTLRLNLEEPITL